MLRFARAGRAVYAKKATLSVVDGHLMGGGCDLLPAVSVPSDVVSIEADLEGNLIAVKPSGKAKIGKLVLAMFPDEGALTRDGNFMISSNRPLLGEAGQDLFGVIRTLSDETIKAAATPTSRVAATPVASTPTSAKRLPPIRPIVAPYRPAQKLKVELPVVSIRPENEAKGDKILLSDIADVTAEGPSKALLESAPIGDTPSLGVSRGLDAVTITSALARAGWKLGSYVLNMTPGAKVHRQAQEILDEKFVEAARDAVRGQLRILAPLHSDIAQPPMSCPLGEVSLKAETCSKAGLGATVSVALYVDGRRINSRTVQLSPDKDAVGVASGQRIKIVARAAGATVELSGKAKEQGWAGQQVSVETDTGAVLTGTVKEDGSVEVSL